MNGLTITPSLSELTILPGAKTNLQFELTNTGPDMAISLDLAPFVAHGTTGQVELTTANLINWVTFNSPKIKPGGKIILNGGETRDINLKIAPPAGTSGDYYLALTATSEPNINLTGSGVITKMRIGSNLLIRVYNTDTKRDAVVSNYYVPAITDTFLPVNIKITVTNAGNTFFKPIGGIINARIFSDQEIKLQPVNVLAGSERVVPYQGRLRCYIGACQIKTAFKIDDSGQIFEAQKTVFAFPFLLTIIIIIILIVLKTKVLSFAPKRR